MNLYRPTRSSIRLRAHRPRVALSPARRRRRDLSSRLQSSPRSASPTGSTASRGAQTLLRSIWDLNNFVWTNDNPVETHFPPTAISHRPFASVLAVLDSAAGSSPGHTAVHPHAAPGPPTRRSTSTTPCPSRTTPTSRSARNGSTTPISSLKTILPPKAVDTPEELAQLSQFVINIIDFRDPDCTMTHWVNPDVMVIGCPCRRSPLGRRRVRATYRRIARPQMPAPARDPASSIAARPVRHGVQPGRDQRRCWLIRSCMPRQPPARLGRANRFFAELVNTADLARAWRLRGSTFNPVLDARRARVPGRGPVLA